MANATELCSNWLDSYFKDRPQMKAPPMGVFGYEMPEWTAAVIQKLLGEKLGLIEECSEIREKLAAMESQEPAASVKSINRHGDIDIVAVDDTLRVGDSLYTKPAPADKPARITEQDAYDIILNFFWFMESYKHKNAKNPSVVEWHDSEGRDLLNKLNADREAERFCDAHCTWLDHHPDCPSHESEQGGDQ